MWYTLWIVAVTLAIRASRVISFNQPNFGSCETWSTNAVTVADQSSVGRHPTGVFITTNSNLYVIDQQHGQVLMWSRGSLSVTETIATKALSSMSLFVTEKGDVLVDNGRVDRWFANGTGPFQMMHINSSCTGLFVDIADRLYCSSAHQHRVFRQTSDSSVTESVAGTGCPGPLANMLDHPHGVFVDGNFNLFIADTYNNRIQRFAEGQSEAMTVAGFGASVTFLLRRPTSVVLDGNERLFIVDSGNHRIVRSVPNGFECLIGCAGQSGSSASQLFNPHAMAFDCDGNIVVTDFGNHRVQKFALSTRLCVAAPIVATTCNTVIYSQTFTSGLPHVVQCSLWRSFVAELTARSYTSLTMRGTFDQVGATLTDPNIIAKIALALRTSTAFGPVTSNSRSWVAGLCGSWYELSASGTICSCPDPGYAIRPCIANSNYGGINSTTCSGPTQTLTVIFQY